MRKIQGKKQTTFCLNTALNICLQTVDEREDSPLDAACPYQEPAQLLLKQKQRLTRQPDKSYGEKVQASEEPV